MSLLTSIYSSILKITASNFQETLIRDSYLQKHHWLDIDLHNHKVPFVISWPIYIFGQSMSFACLKPRSYSADKRILVIIWYNTFLNLF